MNNALYLGRYHAHAFAQHNYQPTSKHSFLTKRASNVCVTTHTLARGFPSTPFAKIVLMAGTIFANSKSYCALFVKRSAAKILNSNYIYACGLGSEVQFQMCLVDFKLHFVIMNYTISITIKYIFQLGLAHFEIGRIDFDFDFAVTHAQHSQHS